jgi:cytidine deaminase
MKNIEIKTPIVIYDGLQELPDESRLLMEQAMTTKNSAYAPYSKFKVGAAVLLGNGKMVTGNNQENAAYPSGMCAERIAFWNAATLYPNEIIVKLAITASSSSHTLKEPVAPCGACRQTLLEYELNQEQVVEVYLMGEEGKIIKVHALVDLLPIAFDRSFL